MRSYIVDSFTTEPFKGNPAGVCFPEQELSDEHMLKIAAEFGFSETAFVRESGTQGFYTIRFFSPKKEIPMCGHATLAASKVLFKTTTHTEVHLINIQNIDLFVKKRDDEMVMQFPVYDVVPATAPAEMLRALGIDAVARTSYSNEKKIILLEISDAAVLAALEPDFDALVRSYSGINGVLVTAPSNMAEYDFQYRYFWPWAGTNEDPVTGAVQSFLTKYWAEKLGKNKLSAFQCSARTGTMKLELQSEKVLIIGKAVIILEGTLTAFD